MSSARRTGNDELGTRYLISYRLKACSLLAVRKACPTCTVLGTDLLDRGNVGSWAKRFFGRAKLPPLVDAKGEPTRLALSAHAWGEKVPKTEKAARKIAKKGEKLLKRYHKLQAKG